MTSVIRIAGAFLAAVAISVALSFVFSPAAEAAGKKPKLAATGAIWTADDGSGAKMSVNIYSKNTFKVKSWKELRKVANRYRPKNVVLHFQGRKMKLTQISELMPEFVFPFYGAYIPGFFPTQDYSAKVTFKNKAKKGTQTLKVKLVYEELPTEEEEYYDECDLDNPDYDAELCEEEPIEDEEF